MNALLEVWPLWWIGSFCACAAGLLLARAHRAPVHRVAWMRWSLLALFVWAAAALVPADRLYEHEDSEVSTLLETPRPDPMDTRPVHNSVVTRPPTTNDLLTELLRAQAELAQTRELVSGDSADSIELERRLPVSPIPADAPIERGALPADPRTPPTSTDSDAEPRFDPVALDTLVATERPALESPAPKRAVAKGPEASNSWNWSNTLVWSWLGGTVVVLTWLAFGRLRLQRILSRTRPANQRDVRIWLQQSRRSAGTPRVVVSPDAVTPFCTGLFRPTIVLPNQLCDDESDAIRRAVLEHELSHLAHRDPWTTLLMNTALIVFWPQPLVWLLRRSLRREVERRADERAALRIGVRDYAARLIELREHLFARPTPAALSMARHPSEFFRRMETLMKRPLPTSTTTSIRARLLRSALATTFCVLAIASFGRDLQAQDRARVSRVEQRISRVETRLDELGSLLRDISNTLQQMQAATNTGSPPPSGRDPRRLPIATDTLPIDESASAADPAVPTVRDLPLVSAYLEQHARNADTAIDPEAVDAPAESGAEADAGVPMLRNLPLLSELFDQSARDTVASTGEATADAPTDTAIATNNPFDPAGHSRDGWSVALQYLQLGGTIRNAEERLARLTPLFEAGQVSSEELNQVTNRLQVNRDIRDTLRQLLELEIMQLRSSLELAEEEFNRNALLVERGFMTEGEMRRSAITIERLRATLDQFQTVLDRGENSSEDSGEQIGVVIRWLPIRDGGDPQVVIALEDGATLAGNLSLASSQGNVYGRITEFRPVESEFGNMAICRFKSRSRNPRQGDILVRRGYTERSPQPATGLGGGLDGGVGGGTGGGQAAGNNQVNRDPLLIESGHGAGGAAPARNSGQRRRGR